MGPKEAKYLTSLSALAFLKFLKDKQVESVEWSTICPWANFHDKNSFDF